MNTVFIKYLQNYLIWLENRKSGDIIKHMEHFPEVQRILESSPSIILCMCEIFSFFNHLNEKKKMKHQTETTMNFINLNPYERGQRKKYQTNVWA